MNCITDDTENSENAINKEKSDDAMVNTELTQIDNQEEDLINESSMERSTKINETPAEENIERTVIIDASIKLDHQRIALIEPDEDDGSMELQEEIEIEVTKRKKRILDESDDEDNMESSENIDGKKLVANMSPKINISHIESVSEDVTATEVLSTENKTNRSDEDSDDEGNFSMIRKNKTKLKALIDSDSEDESQTKISSVQASNRDLETESKTESPKKPNAKPKFNGLIDSDSEDDASNAKKTTSSTIKPTKQKQLKHKSSKISTLVDSDSDSDSNSNQSQHEESQLSEEEIKQNENEQHEEDNRKYPKQMRASAKKALDEMQAIQSEQQRLHREAQISIPYHKPKRHTLQEFLKRRTIQQPLQRDGGSPAGVTKPLKSLKMTAEELAEYAKLMEARAKEAKEFFKSESEDDEPKNDNFINDTTDLDNNESIKPVEAESANENIISEQKKEESVVNEIEMNVDQSAVPVEAEGGLTIEPENPPTQPIITEVVELPKLNINTLKVAPPSTTETVYKLIHDKKLTDSPSLKGDPNMLIDLETGDLVAKQPTGVDNLFQRFMAAKAKRKHKSTETLSILSTDNGKMEVSTVNVHIHDEPDDNKETKPGEAYFKLKENLRSIIKKKRLDELEKKKAERLEEELEHQKCLDDDEEEDLLDDDDEEGYDEEKLNGRKKAKCSDAILIDDEENAIDLEEDDGSDFENDEEKPDDVEADENIEESTGLNEDAGEEDEEADDNNDDDNEDGDNDDDTDDDDSDDDDANPTENEDNSKRKSRIIKAFQPDSDEEIDFLRTPTQTKIDAEKLFDEEATQKPDPIKGENELLELCSGKFEDTTQVSSIISQIPMTQANASAAAADEELLGLCSGTFEDKPDEETQTQTTARKKILSSDDENPSNETQPKRVKKLTKRASKNKAKLGFSDDEDDDEQTTATGVISADEQSLEADEEEDIPQTFIDYDSEENEIVVEMTKKDCLKQAENFFEKEAELSESEWGSADEDEKHMDKYDIELGDEDEFDREKLQTELGQIHARKMLDEDIREVRKIQEMLFEDEEKDGVGRQRQFKWKNIESGFSLDDPSGENAFTHGENGESGDEENEQLWRKIRYEREQLLKEKNLKEDISVSIINSTLSSTSFGGNTTMLQTSSVKKLNIISAKKIQSNAPNKKSSPFLISKSMSVLEKRPARGSFLIRDKETLSKLAGLTKGGAQDADGTSGTVAVKAIKPQNFVFATLTEEEHAILKRKSDDLLNSSAEHGINYLKRPKIEPRREKCFIDQLL